MGLLKIIQEIWRDPFAKLDYQWVNNQLLFKGRLYLPQGSTLIPILLQEGHDGSCGGHSGFLKTYKGIAATVYWAEMKKDIHCYVSQCQQHKYQQGSPLCGRSGFTAMWSFRVPKDNYLPTT